MVAFAAAPCTHTALAPVAVATIVAIVYTGVAGTSAVAEFGRIPAATVACITERLAAGNAGRGLLPGVAGRRHLSAAAGATVYTGVFGTGVVFVIAAQSRRLRTDGAAAVAVTAVSAAMPCPCVACRATVAAVAIVDHGAVVAATADAAGIVSSVPDQQGSVDGVAAVRPALAAVVCRPGVVTAGVAFEGACPAPVVTSGMASIAGPCAVVPVEFAGAGYLLEERQQAALGRSRLGG